MRLPTQLFRVGPACGPWRIAQKAFVGSYCNWNNWILFLSLYIYNIYICVYISCIYISSGNNSHGTGELHMLQEGTEVADRSTCNWAGWFEVSEAVGSCLWNWRFPIQIVEFSENLIIWDGNYMYITCLESLEVKVLAAMGTTWKGEAKHLWSLRQQNQCHKHLEKTTAINLAWLLILGLMIGSTTLHFLPRIIINDEIMILTDTARLRTAPLRSNTYHQCSANVDPPSGPRFEAFRRC